MTEKTDRLEELRDMVGIYYENVSEQRDIFRTVFKNSAHMDDIDVANVLAAHKKVVTIWRECYKKIVYKTELYDCS
jgi:hypothetical protein